MSRTMMLLTAALRLASYLPGEATPEAPCDWCQGDGACIDQCLEEQADEEEGLCES